MPDFRAICMAGNESVAEALKPEVSDTLDERLEQNCKSSRLQAMDGLNETHQLLATIAWGRALKNHCTWKSWHPGEEDTPCPGLVWVHTKFQAGGDACGGRGWQSLPALVGCHGLILKWEQFGDSIYRIQKSTNILVSVFHGYSCHKTSWVFAQQQSFLSI